MGLNMGITTEEYNALIDEYEATHAELVHIADKLAGAQTSLLALQAENDRLVSVDKERAKALDTASNKLIFERQKSIKLSSELLAEKVQHTATTKALNAATKSLETVRKETKRLVAQVKRNKEAKPTVTPAAAKKISDLEHSLKMNQDVLNKSAIFIGSFDDHRGVHHLAFDDRLSTMIDDSGEFLGHRVIVIDEYGSGKVCYKKTTDGTLHVCKANPAKRFQHSKALDSFLEGYFEKCSDAFYKAGAKLKRKR